MKHPHHDMIQEWIKDIETGRIVQRLFSGEWIDDKNPGWYLGERYRFKPEPPKYIVVNGVSVPEPVRKELEEGQQFWFSGAIVVGPSHRHWDGNSTNRLWLRLGLIHLAEEAAQAHIDAMLAPSRTDK